MADDDETRQIKSRNIAYLREAMMEKKYGEVRRLCSKTPGGPLERISIYDDTVLHMAAHSKQEDLVLDLLKMIPEDRNHELSDIKNTDGNTILHELATSNAMASAAMELLRRDPDLVTASNDLGEKPIFCAARYGQISMFHLLALKLRELTPEESKAYLQRNDGTTVLHVSIATESFELAKLIVISHPYLIGQRDHFSMTALQYLARNPTVFGRWKMQIRRGFIELLSNSNFDETQGLIELFTTIYDIFIGDKTNNERYAFQYLVEDLVKNDDSWNMSISTCQAMSSGEKKKEPEMEICSSALSQEKEGQNSQEISANKNEKSDESPLFLAAMSDIKEIVKLVLKHKPEALKHTNKEGMNILHVAILYRHMEIFKIVVKDEGLARRLLSATDNEKNSVLHMVSQKRTSQASEKMQSPALQLRNELLLFEEVKSTSKMLVSNPLNKDKKTAEELFATANESLHRDAKEWLMRTAENCTILSVFIATVAFAAAYTVPGGPDQKTGIPILHPKPLFLVFTIADIISLASALTSVGIFLSILTSSFPLQDFKMYLFKKLIQGIICLVLSVSMMGVAFGATIGLMMSHNRENVAWSAVAFLPVPIFFLSYSPLRSAVLGPWGQWFQVLVGYFVLVVAILVILLPSLLLLVIYLVFRGLGRILKKAWLSIGSNPLCWIRGIRIKPPPKSDTESSRPGEAPLTHV